MKNTVIREVDNRDMRQVVISYEARIQAIEDRIGELEAELIESRKVSRCAPERWLIVKAVWESMDSCARDGLLRPNAVSVDTIADAIERLWRK